MNSLIKISPKSLLNLIPKIDYSLFSAFSVYPDSSIFKVDIPDINTDTFGYTHAGAQEEGEKSSIPYSGLFVIILDPLLARLKVKGLPASVIVFVMWTLSLAFFRAEGLDAALGMIGGVGFGNAGSVLDFGLGGNELAFSLAMLAALMCFEYVSENMERKGKNILDMLVFSRPAWLRWSIYMVMVFAVILFGVYATNNDNSFIYFQF